MPVLSSVVFKPCFLARSACSHNASIVSDESVEIVSKKGMTCLAMSLFGISYSSFLCAIRHVIFLISKSEMFRVKATCVIARVKNNMGALEIKSKPERCCKPMDPDGLPIESDHAISVGVLSVFPVPASSVRINRRIVNGYHENMIFQDGCGCNKKYNSTSSSITPSALTLNWRVAR